MSEFDGEFVAPCSGHEVMPIVVPQTPTPAIMHDEVLGDNNQCNPERLLTANFSSIVSTLCLPELMVPVGRRVRRAEIFGLIALTGPPLKNTLETGPESLRSAGRVRPTQADIRMTYKRLKLPYLDTTQAIGLVRDHQPYDGSWDPGENRWLIAIAGAGVDVQGRVVIKQFQDVTCVGKEHEVRYRHTGLHSGFRWRETLVNAWQQVAVEIGSPSIVIKSYRTHDYAAVREHGKDGYDGVASRMDFTPDANARTWEWLVT